jgi:2-methylisocitrate lyase-like PEP mutase family enzyme
MSEKTTRRGFVRAAGIAAGGMLAGPMASPAAEPQNPKPPMSNGARLRQLLKRPEPFYCISAFDSPSARLIELAGFEAIYSGGSLMAMEHGFPDWGLTNTTDLLEFASRLQRNVDIPVIGDCDNGGGNPVNAYHAAKEYERVGLGGILLEDRIRIEKIGQKGDVISTELMVERIKAAADARSEMIIIGRTDALGVGRSLDEAIARGKAYAEAGADAILFPGLQKLEVSQRAIKEVPKPMFIQMGPNAAKEDALKIGAHVLFYTSMMQDIALAAYLQALTELKNTGKLPNAFNSHKLPDEVTVKLERSDEILERARKYKWAPPAAK